MLSVNAFAMNQRICRPCIGNLLNYANTKWSIIIKWHSEILKWPACSCSTADLLYEIIHWDKFIETSASNNLKTCVFQFLLKTSAQRIAHWYFEKGNIFKSQAVLHTHPHINPERYETAQSLENNPSTEGKKEEVETSFAMNRIIYYIEIYEKNSYKYNVHARMLHTQINICTKISWRGHQILNPWQKFLWF